MTRYLIFLLLLASPLSTPYAQENFDRPLTNLGPVDQSIDYASQIGPKGEVVTFTARQPCQPLRNLLRGIRGSIWRWARPASHHNAAVVVRGPRGAGGSGTVVRVSGARSVVITCHHVIEGSPYAQVEWQTGQSVRGEIIQSWPQYDLAAIVINVSPEVLTSVPISSRSLSARDEVEVMGFGGPKYGTFRPYLAAPVRGYSKLCIDSPSIHGDSGAGMLVNGELVGVQYGGTDAKVSYAQGSSNMIPLIYPASSKADPDVLRQFMTAVCQRMGGGCQPIYGQPQVQIDRGVGGDQQFYPSPQQSQPQDIPLPQPQFAPQPQFIPQPPAAPQNYPLQASVTLDPQSIAAAVAEQLRGDPSLKGDKGERGVAGPVGPEGPSGRDADINQVAAMVLAQIPTPKEPDIPAIAQAVVAAIPDTPIEIFDNETGEVLFTGVLRNGTPLRIPYRRDKPSTFGLNGMTEEDREQLASIMVAGLSAKGAEDLAAKLPPAMLQPGYEDKDGNLLAYKFSKPLAVRLGATSTLPPNQINVNSPSGKTRASAPIGVPMNLELGKPRTGRVER